MRPISFFSLFAGLVFSSLAQPALAAPSVDSLDALNKALLDQQNTLNHMWTMLAAALVAFMQGGFLLLEAGMVRSKNSINVAQKNITDFIVSILCFYLIGFMIMFGPSAGGLLGWDFAMAAADQMSDWSYTFFVFQAVFVGTAATCCGTDEVFVLYFDGDLLILCDLSGVWALGLGESAG